MGNIANSIFLLKQMQDFYKKSNSLFSLCLLLQLTIFCPWLFILLFSSNKQDTSEKLDTIFYKHENTGRLEEVIFFVTLCSSQARKKNQKCFSVHFIILHRRTFLECHSFWQNEEEIAIYPSCSFALFLKSILILIDAVTSTKKWGELIFLLHLLIQFSRQQKEATWLPIGWFFVLLKMSRVVEESPIS